MVSLTISLGPFIKGAHTGPSPLATFQVARDTPQPCGRLFLCTPRPMERPLSDAPRDDVTSVSDSAMNPAAGRPPVATERIPANWTSQESPRVTRPQWWSLRVARPVLGTAPSVCWSHKPDRQRVPLNPWCAEPLKPGRTLESSETRWTLSLRKLLGHQPDTGTRLLSLPKRTSTKKPFLGTVPPQSPQKPVVLPIKLKVA